MSMATDYDLESQALVRALKQADAMKAMQLNTGIPANRMVGGRYVAPGVGELMNAFVTPQIGQYEENRVMDKQRALNDQQRGEYDQLLKEVTTPGTRRVLKQTLGDDLSMGPSMKEVETQVPLTPLEDSQRRMGIYGKMDRLPMAKQIAQAGIKSEVDFPERQALAAQQQAALKETQAARLAQQAQQQDTNNIFKSIVLGQGQQRLDQQQGKIDDVQMDKDQKADTAKEAHLTGLGNLRRILTEVKGTPNIKSALGGFDANTPWYLSMSPNDKATAVSRVKNLQEYLQSKGLEDLNRAGVKPGSVTEKEWSKFAARIGNIDPRQSDEAFLKEVDRLTNETNLEIERVSASPSRAERRTGGTQQPAVDAAPAGTGTKSQYDPTTGKTYVKGANGKWYTR